MYDIRFILGDLTRVEKNIRLPYIPREGEWIYLPYQDDNFEVSGVQYFIEDPTDDTKSIHMYSGLVVFIEYNGINNDDFIKDIQERFVAKHGWKKSKF